MTSTSAYCTAAELRTQIEKTGVTGAASDAALAILIDAASRAIDNFCNRPDGFVSLSTAAARVYTGDGRPFILIDEFTSITALGVKDSPTDTTYTAWATTDYLPFSGDPEAPDWNSLPYNALMVLPSGDYSIFTNGVYRTTSGFRPDSDRLPYGTPTVQATAKWGYAVTAPGAIKEATISLAARWMKRGQGAWSDTLASAEMGTLLYSAELRDVRFMLEAGRYVRPATGRR